MADRELQYYKDEAEYYRNQIDFSKKYYAAPARGGLLAKCKRLWTRLDESVRSKQRRRAEKKRKKELSVPYDGLNRGKIKRAHPLVVSLTSYPGRIGDVAAVVGSMLRQTLQPDRICVYLGEKQFASLSLPKELAALRDRGLVEICFREDIKPHTKYFYAMREHPDAVIVTVDDDILYRPTLLEELWRSYERFPACVSCVRAHKIRFDLAGNVLPYGEWIGEYHFERDVPDNRLLATGVGGVLYPPHCFSEEAFDLETIRKTCLSADDLWLKVMELRQGRQVVLCADSSYPQEVLSSAHSAALMQENLSGRNDKQLQAILEHYSMHLIDWMDKGI